MTPTSNTTQVSGSIPLGQKIAFGAGMLGNQLFPAALSIFMVVLVKGLGMSPILWGLLFFVPRLLDAITDPLMGFISDNTVSRWGRRKPYVFIGGILSGIFFVLMWQVYPENGEMFNFWYFLFFSMMFYVGLTIFSVPYVAMGYEMSGEYHERTRLMAVAQWIGQWAWVIVPWFWVLIYDPSLFEDAAEGARTLSIGVGMFCALLAVIPAIYCATQDVDTNTLKPINKDTLRQCFSDIYQSIKQVFRIPAFARICGATFFVFNAFNTVAGFSWFIIVYLMNGGDAGAAGTWPAWFGTLSALSTCFLVIPIVTAMSARLGKKNTFMICQSISLVGYGLFYWCFDPSQPWMMFIPLPLFAFGIGSLFTIMMSMTADICDLDDLTNGVRREGVLGAIFWWMVKFGFAIAGLLSGLILSVVGFDQSIAAQPADVLEGLKLSYIIVPSIGTIIAMFIMRGYDLDEQRAGQVRHQLETRNEAK